MSAHVHPLNRWVERLERHEREVFDPVGATEMPILPANSAAPQSLELLVNLANKGIVYYELVLHFMEAVLALLELQRRGTLVGRLLISGLLVLFARRLAARLP